MMDAHVLLDDEQKHRHFDGTVSAHDVSAVHGAEPFRIEGKGEMNGRPVNFEFTSDPLRTASRDKQYAFSFNERSSGSHLVASGFLHQGFDLRTYDATFEASGADLRDMQYLTGARLIDTGAYRLTGTWRDGAIPPSTAICSSRAGRATCAVGCPLTRPRASSILMGNWIAVLASRRSGPRAAGRDPRSRLEPVAPIHCGARSDSTAPG